MSKQSVAFQFRNYRTLPLTFENVIIDKDILPYSKVELEVAHFDPKFIAPRYEYSKECLVEVSQRADLAIEAVREWLAHYANLGYYLQFHDDRNGAKLNRIRSHTELVSAILSSRLNIDDDPFWDAFEWLVRFKIVQESYRSDPARIANYDKHVQELRELDAGKDERDKTRRRIQRAESEIKLRTGIWASLPPIHSTDTSRKIAKVSLFYCYSHKDEFLRDELEKHLSVLQRNGHINPWHDRRIGPGLEWRGEIDTHLKESQIILLLVSSDFLASDYCYDVELQLALSKHESGNARVIPVFLRPCDWQGSKFEHLQGLPKDATPVTNWSNRDDAFLDIARGIRQVVEELSVTPES